jgi:hypothetical protein
MVPTHCFAPAYRAGDHAIVCYRAVRQNPAQLVDFVAFAHLATSYAWWDHHRAIGVSCFTDPDEAVATLGRPDKGYAYLAELDLSRMEPRTVWPPTGRQAHVTIWAPPPQLLQAVVQYADIGARQP